MGVKVLLDSVEKVRDFIDITRSAPYDIDLISGRNTYLDAKSLLGILSCDCRKPCFWTCMPSWKNGQSSCPELKNMSWRNNRSRKLLMIY